MLGCVSGPQGTGIFRLAGAMAAFAGAEAGRYKPLVSSAFRLLPSAYRRVHTVLRYVPVLL
jgi:hypothetical protein